MSSYTALLNSDLYTPDYFLQEDVCRLCWEREAYCEISSKTSQKNDKLKNEFVDKIMYCLDLDFRDISYPNKACNSCFSKIEEFHEFKAFCRETDRRLREILTKLRDKIVERPIFDVKIEKLDNELTGLILTKDTLLGQTTDFFDELNDSDSASDCQPLINEVKHRDKAPVKRNKYKLKKSPTYCNICRFDLDTKDNLSLHNAQSHGIEEDTGLFKCFGCDKRFKSRKTRLGHEINFCKGLKDGYKCGKCDRYLPKRRTYEAHMRDHREKVVVELPEDIFQCVKCFTFFKTRNSLKEHMSMHEMDRKNFVCETCGRVFTRQDYLHKHKLTHSGTKRHVCPHCGFRTTQRSSLTVHIRKHTGERPYACDVCPQRCVSSSNLRAHRRRHMPPPHKHHECTICGKKFGYKVSLGEHVSSCHERARQFACARCAAVYSRARALRRHIRDKHPTEDGDTTEPEKMATDAFLKMADEGGKKAEAEVIKEVSFEVKTAEEFVILNEGALVASIY